MQPRPGEESRLLWDGVKMSVKGSTRQPRWFTEQAAHVQDEKKSLDCCTDVMGKHPGPRSRLDAAISWDEGHWVRRGMMAR